MCKTYMEIKDYCDYVEGLMYYFSIGCTWYGGGKHISDRDIPKNFILVNNGGILGVARKSWFDGDLSKYKLINKDGSFIYSKKFKCYIGLHDYLITEVNLSEDCRKVLCKRKCKDCGKNNH